ncbi:MAG: energy-coupling factor transporter transmembrane protein EcfT [Anaerolineae bacterium]|nr:energy-coupling factor transporter transmembrane protein EcfT [Anaerolineae bacterium]
MQDDEARFAPPDIDSEESPADNVDADDALPEVTDDSIVTTDDAVEAAESLETDDAPDMPEGIEVESQVEEEVIFSAEADEGEMMNFSPDLDIDAALAAVSTLDDVLAAREAAEQERLAREESELAARQQREARMQHPELFFPMPPMTTIQRGRIDSVVPALALIVIGAWLTFVLTTTQNPPNSTLVTLAVVGAVGLSLLARWIASGRWARGALFFALLLMFTTGATIALIMTGNFVTGWPLVIAAAGLAFLLTNRWLAVMLIVVGVLGWTVTAGMFPANLLAVTAGLWPVALVLVLIFLLMPILFRRRE